MITCTELPGATRPICLKIDNKNNNRIHTRTDLVEGDLEKLRRTVVTAVVTNHDLMSILEEVDDNVTPEQHTMQRH